MVPRLDRLPKGGHELVVNGKPFLCRAGELNNSSFSSPRYMDTVWPRLVDLNLNTVFAAVGWDEIEPEEGRFDFAALDENLVRARQHDLKLVLLWFGSHKNGHMNYAPSWVKTNPRRFPRCITGDSKICDYLSVFSTETANADAKAFCKLMEHLKRADGAETVIMVQVENEVGVLGDTRDRSTAANEDFHSPVPGAFLDALETNDLNHLIRANFFLDNLPRGRSWPDTFGVGPLTDELFMAYHYATFVDTVAAAGKVYPIPLFTNAALRATRHTARDGGTGGGAAPGIYPSGGPVDTVIDAWQLVATHLDFVSPDIYFADYETMCKEYTHRGQALVIPEQRRDEYGALRMWVAMGTYGAIAASPFGIDSLPLDDTAFQRHFALLRDVSPALLEARRLGQRCYGFYFDAFPPGAEDPSASKTVAFDEYTLTIERQPVFGHPAVGYGCIIERAPDTFLLIGEGYQVTFKSDKAFTGILSLEEKEAVHGELTTLRRLNGDETHCGKQAVMPSQQPDDGWYPIPINIPSRTRIAECRVYSF